MINVFNSTDMGQFLAYWNQMIDMAWMLETIKIVILCACGIQRENMPFPSPLFQALPCLFIRKVSNFSAISYYDMIHQKGSMETPILDLFLYIIRILELSSTHLYHNCWDSHLLGTPFFSGGLKLGLCKLWRKDPHEYFVLASNELQTRHHFLIRFCIQGFYCPKNSNGLMYCIRFAFSIKPFSSWSTV